MRCIISLPDFHKHTQATSYVWGESGATGGLGSVTNTLSLDALASGSARMGAEVDLGEYWDQEYIVTALIESGTAPTAGSAIDVYLAWSPDGTNYPAGVTGSDAAWPSDGNEDEWAKQLGPPAVSVIGTNDGSVSQQQNSRIIRARGRYVCPVVDNNWDQAVRDEVTATNNDSRIMLTPLRSLIQDAAT